ncbi:putative metalloprotease CJM1_0395 family protein [Psychromonas ossibalaenae]|uniref:putative metalloprotease CJM1_0395 family protein n=1 Tax=Psychromonas ossibalaenae TaxID=444922 RepID=UPI0003749444|nr:putative metalloprotease CJM1_0395 family protein [Psychromonas ossibalaenae]
MNISTASSAVHLAASSTVQSRHSVEVSASPVIPVSAPQVDISVSPGTTSADNISENPTYQKPVNLAPEKADKSVGGQPSDAQEKQTEVDPQTVEGADKKTNEPDSNQENEQYSETELKQISNLQVLDAEVITHERAHASVGGQYAGSPHYNYQTGPDGVKYAVSGEVSIDTSRVPNDPQATLRKAQQIKAAALAPAEPSSQDRRVAAKAGQMAAEARSDIQQELQGDGEESISSRRYESHVPEHFTGQEHLAEETNAPQLVNRSAQISDVYRDSSVIKENSTFQTQI